MSWWNPRTWGGGTALAAQPDLGEFERASWSIDALSGGQVMQLAAYGTGCRPDTRPDLLPVEVLDLMGWDPVIYAGERALTSPALDPELYYLRGDPALVAETEEWLRPLLARLLPMIARAFAYGEVPIVLDWQLTVSGPSYGRPHELSPGDAQIRVENDRLLAVVHGGVEYGGEDLPDPGRVRAFLALWDAKFGRWQGAASRRRAFRAWLEGGMCELWRIRYLERSVDLARLGFAPEGELKIDGRDVSAVKLLRAQLMSLRNGSTMALPSTRDDAGNPKWDVKILDSPDRTDAFERVVDSYDKRKLWATLSPGAPADKASEEQAMDAVQSVCDFVAAVLTRIVRPVTQLRHGLDAPRVLVLANDVPKRKIRLLSQIFANAANAAQHLPDGRTYTLAELVHPEILDQLGVRARAPEEAAHAAAPPVALPSLRPPGRPLDVTSEREDRRDASESVEGEDDTGGEETEREERP